MLARSAAAVVVRLAIGIAVPGERSAMTGADRRALHSALIDAFPTVADLQRVVSFGLETTLDEIAPPASLFDQAFALVLWCDRHNRIGDRPMMFPIDKHEAIDIDEEIDFRIAELMHLEAQSPRLGSTELVAGGRGTIRECA